MKTSIVSIMIGSLRMYHEPMTKVGLGLRGTSIEQLSHDTHKKDH